MGVGNKDDSQGKLSQVSVFNGELYEDESSAGPSATFVPPCPLNLV